MVKLKFNPEVDFCPGCGALLPRLVPARTLCTFRLVAQWLSINPLLLMELLLGERENHRIINQLFSLEARGDVKCLVCKFTVSSNLYDEKVIQYTVKFNAVQTTKVEIYTPTYVHLNPFFRPRLPKKRREKRGR